MTSTFDVCSESATWTRPTAAVQQRVSTDRRYLGKDGQPVPLARYCWQQNFFVFSDVSASIETLFRRLTGLWSAAATLAQCDHDALARLRARQSVEMWLIYHRVTGLELGAGVVTVHVAPQDKGFQIINVPMPQASRQFRFVDPGGHVLDTLGDVLTADAIAHIR